MLQGEARGGAASFYMYIERLRLLDGTGGTCRRAVVEGCRWFSSAG